MTRATLVLGAVAAVLAAGAPSAPARPATVNLRVVGALGQVASTEQRTDTVRVETDRRARCFTGGRGGSGRAVTVRGPTALGALVDAARRFRRLRPLWLTDEFEFGLGLCRVGRDRGNRDRAWLYRVNHRFGQVAADSQEVRSGDRVLWYFSDSRRRVNTGRELRLIAPSRVRPGRRFTVTVIGYDRAGRSRRVRGARVGMGRRTARTDRRGRARLRAPRPRSQGARVTLRASRGSHIPAAPRRVCVSRSRSACRMRG